MKIKIVADRMIDYKDEELKALDIDTMSCYINFGGKSYDDTVEVKPDQLFEHHKKTGEIAKTAAKSDEQYYEWFKQYTDQGLAVIHFAASSGISAICSLAMKAAERLPNVYVVDSKSLSGGIALLVGYAMELIEAGETDPKKVFEAVIEKRKKLVDSFIIETLTYLHKGGRCSSLTYYAANLLRIRPVITLDKTTAKMLTREKCKGALPKAHAQYIANTFAKYPNPDLKHLYIAYYAKDKELIDAFVRQATSYHKFENVHILDDITCNTTIHSGLNTFGIFFFVK